MTNNANRAASAACDCIEGPAWDITSEYPSISSAEYRADLSAFESELASLEALGAAAGARAEGAAALDPAADAGFLRELGAFAVASDLARARLGSLQTYARCVLSADGSDAEAAATRGLLDGYSARLGAAVAPLSLVLKQCPEAFFEAFCLEPGADAFRFSLSLERKDAARALALPAERALASMAASGFHAWGALYDSLTGTLRCRVRSVGGGEESVGLAKAASLLKRPEPELRESAWRGINAALSVHRHSFAAVLNALSGWRGSEGALRSHAEPVHYLDGALRQNRISKATLDALLGVLKESRELGRRALRAQAALYGVERLGPWDILAPAPAADGSRDAIPFERGLGIVRRAYASVDPSMGAFVDAMAASGRIEGRVKDGKRPGAYCTEFPLSRRPFVYTTYRGSLSELSTLAHELGHAYHCEAMRDIPLAESDYPMTLAETASTFAETALGELLASEATSDAERLELAWADAQDAATFLVNIPARFEFESRFYERRPSGPSGPDELGAIMRDAWAEWYGDSLSAYDEWYWASKLHFHKSGASFYNFPYSFGYLFSLGVYARREALGPGFHRSYVALLRDTGRMEAEELAARHLGADITKPGFWRDSVRIVEGKVERFEALAMARRSEG
ncbi:MAG: M3 family oligoendopeptidase [Spirochaetes bacterium]|nr:M3 family oligoendopeptidase [Spirochaetota bacterium]MBU1080213.1 M3 family oligoendopeptidase [Spirochaetota bacterium]